MRRGAKLKTDDHVPIDAPPPLLRSAPAWVLSSVFRRCACPGAQSALVLNNKSMLRFEPGMVFNLAVGLHDVPLSTADRAGALGSIKKLDKATVLIIAHACGVWHAHVTRGRRRIRTWRPVHSAYKYTPDGGVWCQPSLCNPGFAAARRHGARRRIRVRAARGADEALLGMVRHTKDRLSSPLMKCDRHAPPPRC